MDGATTPQARDRVVWDQDVAVGVGGPGRIILRFTCSRLCPTRPAISSCDNAGSARVIASRSRSTEFEHQKCRKCGRGHPYVTLSISLWTGTGLGVMCSGAHASERFALPRLRRRDGGIATIIGTLVPPPGVAPNTACVAGS
jgi:hypothetical protein